MIFGILLFQVIFLLMTIFFNNGQGFLLYDEKIFKNYILFETIFQSIGIVANIVMAFVDKHVMIFILFAGCILYTLINVFFSIKAKRKYFSDLENYIVEEKLQSLDAVEIRRYLLEKYQQVYCVDDIKKCLSKLDR